jgi:ubiquinone/menaquinone biosynthesis C-methylase UbiE
VVGLDIHEKTLIEARQRAEGLGLPIEFVRGDVQQMPFADDTFTCCRSERMLQHLPDPRRALSELARVTQPGGRIVLYDTDWETLIVDASDADTTRAILHAKRADVRQGWIGRQLMALMREASLHDITVIPSTLILTDGPLAIALHELRPAATLALQHGEITQAQHDAWFAELLLRHQEQRFFSAVTAFTVCGRKL